MDRSANVAQSGSERNYTYFSMLYPGLGAGHFVLETGIEQASILPHPTHSVRDNNGSSDTNVLDVHLHIRELHDAVRTTQTAVSAVYKNIRDAEAIAKREGACHDRSLSFRFIFFINKNDAELVERLFYVRWYLFSKMHEWQPVNGLAGNIGRLVRPINLALSRVCQTDHGPDKDDWELRRDVLLNDPGFPLPIMSKQEFSARFWNHGPLSSNASIRQHLYRMQNSRGVEHTRISKPSTASGDADSGDAGSGDVGRPNLYVYRYM